MGGQVRGSGAVKQVGCPSMGRPWHENQQLLVSPASALSALNKHARIKHRQAGTRRGRGSQSRKAAAG